ncbi:universal stress protein [Jatrophihabitans sp.]|uniref:universal stress protein n=1 Tax=Jatrophihabitans sp. TaxID=1932789 RepID=UPI0030C770FB|nr:arabinose efflux permease family protein [Jatrophihabitans sp.]
MSQAVVFGYDGSELAGYAIAQAAEQLGTSREAVVVCVWQPADVGFTPVGGQHFDADKAPEVRAAAEQTAAYGAKLAEQAGFSARAVAVEASPIWQGIITAAEDEKASLIVLGAHRHGALAGRLLGHVTPAVLAHFSSSVLVVHEPA